MKKVPSYNVANARDIPVGITDQLSQVLEKEISYERFGTDSTNLVRASTAEFSVAYSPVGSVAFILSITLRK